MSLAEIKTAVDQLSPKEFEELIAFLRQRDCSAWDRQIDEDFDEDGRLRPPPAWLARFGAHTALSAAAKGQHRRDHRHPGVILAEGEAIDQYKKIIKMCDPIDLVTQISFWKSPRRNKRIAGNSLGSVTSTDVAKRLTAAAA